MSQIFDFYDYKNKVFSCNGVNLETIAKEVGTPAYIYSAEALVSNFNKLQKGLKGLNSLICFAMKSNSNLSVLRLLAEAGAGTDIVSGGELFRSHQAGVSAEKIVFSGVGKTKEEMKNGLTFQGKGIHSFNVESIAELFALNQVAKELHLKATVALRFNPDVDPKTHPYISTGIKKNKFGMDRAEIFNCLSHLKQLDHIRLEGISIHIGSQLLSLSPLKDAFERLAHLIEEIQHPIQFVDLGGGIGISYQLEQPPKIEDYCQLIHEVFGEKSKFNSKLKIILEPGRQISGNAGVLLTQILFRKQRRSQDFLIIDAAMNDLIRPALYGSYHEIVPIQAVHLEGKMKKTMVVGPVCESSDFIGKSRKLSQNLKSGDFLAILSAGAYGFTMSGQYNSRPRPPEVLIQNGNFRIVRKRESFEDLIQGELSSLRH